MVCYWLNDWSLSPSLLPEMLARSYLPHVLSICPPSLTDSPRNHVIHLLYPSCFPVIHWTASRLSLSYLLSSLFQAADYCVMCARPFLSLVSILQWPPLEGLCVIYFSAYDQVFFGGLSVCLSGTQIISPPASAHLQYHIASKNRLVLSCLSHDY